jgi:putative hemolysin
MVRALSFLFRLPPFRSRYLQSCRRDSRPFSARALAALGIEVTTAVSDLAKIPPRGPAVIVANHPRGLVDGLAVLDVVHRVRPDVRVLANYLLGSVPELREHCVFVDPFAGRNAGTRSLAGLRAAAAWLRRGGALVVFPAGMVAPRLNAAGEPVDAAWLSGAAKLAAHAHAPLIPIRLHGTNSHWFYRAGRLHAALRTALLPIEMLRHAGVPVSVRVGTAIDARSYESATACTEATRAAIDSLGRPRETIAAPVAPDAIARELHGLSADALLFRSGEFEVWCARGDTIPTTLRELGRLRETSFRGVGEGTGRSLDLDDFDRWYEHLFVRNSRTRDIVGAYRIGRADEIVEARGVSGLYTTTLFQYDARLLERMSPALELGRSFVRPEYQRTSSVLLLLWRGIGSLVARQPKYRFLFGAVSISNRYRDSSQRMLMEFLRQHHYAAELAELIRALNPVSRGHSPETNPGPIAHDLKDVDRLIAAAERDGKGMPVLLRQYLKLNATLLGFNVDPEFGDVLDALMMVDLTRVDPAILARYVGRGTAQAVRAAA